MRAQIARGGVIIEPIEEPELNHPVAIERSFDGNQMVDTFVPVGIVAASLRGQAARGSPPSTSSRSQRRVAPQPEPQTKAATA